MGNVEAKTAAPLNVGSLLEAAEDHLSSCMSRISELHSRVTSPPGQDEATEPPGAPGVLPRAQRLCSGLETLNESICQLGAIL